MDLQLALILLGLIVLAYVLIFSYLKGRIATSKTVPWQKIFSMRAASLLSRIKPEKKFRSKQDEPSLISASEFSLDPGPALESQANTVTTNSRVVNERRFDSYRRAKSQDFQRILKIDYWARLPGTKLVSCHDVLAVYRNHELDFEYPHRIHGQMYPRNVWSDLEGTSSEDQFYDLIVSVQMVDRRGAITESELTRTNNLVYELSEKLDRKLQFDMTIEDALGEAKLLDNFCKGHDVLVIVNIASEEGQFFSGKDVQDAAHGSGMKLGDRGMFHLRDSESSDVSFTLANRFEPGAIVQASGEELLTTGVILFMNIPLVTDPSNVFDNMISVGQYIASELSGSLQDPEGGLMDQKAFEKIRQQVNNIGEVFHRVGILPGSDEAFRLF